MRKSRGFARYECNRARSLIFVVSKKTQQKWFTVTSPLDHGSVNTILNFKWSREVVYNNKTTDDYLKYVYQTSTRTED